MRMRGGFLLGLVFVLASWVASCGGDGALLCHAQPTAQVSAALAAQSYDTLQRRYDDLERQIYSTNDLKEVERLEGQANAIGEELTRRNVAALAANTAVFQQQLVAINKILAAPRPTRRQRLKRRIRAWWRSSDE